MTNNVLYMLLLFISLTSCAQEPFDYARRFIEIESKLDVSVKYLKQDYDKLKNSFCVERSGVILISHTTIEKKCYPHLISSFSYFLDQKIFDYIDVHNKNIITFHVDFVSNDANFTETNGYFVYIENNELTFYFKHLIGKKVNIKDKWWYIESIESQF